MQLKARNAIAMYHAVLFLAFGAAYFALDFEKHFGVPKPSAITRVYFAAAVHSTVGFGDITAKTDKAKAIVTAHMMLAWTVPLILVLA